MAPASAPTPRRHRGDYPPFEALLCELPAFFLGLAVGGVSGRRMWGTTGLIVGALAGATLVPVLVRLPRLRREFVTIWDAFEAFGLMVGLMFGVGFAVASPSVGWVTRLAVLLVAPVAGWVVGWLPAGLRVWWLRRRVARLATAALAARLRDPERWLERSEVMRELGRRGEDVRADLPVVITLLRGDSPERRYHGWCLLREFFPELAARIPDYHPSQGRAACEAQAARLAAERE